MPSLFRSDAVNTGERFCKGDNAHVERTPMTAKGYYDGSKLELSDRADNEGSCTRTEGQIKQKFRASVDAAGTDRRTKEFCVVLSLAAVVSCFFPSIGSPFPPSSPTLTTQYSRLSIISTRPFLMEL